MSAEDHPREQDRHSTDTDENATDDDESESMPNDDNPFDDELQSFKDELNAILPGKDPLMNLRVVQTGPVHYSVYSARNGQFTKHRVNVQTGACTCQDQEFNVPSDETREACAHTAACVVQHPQMAPEEQGLMKYFGLLDEASQRLDEIEDIRDTLEGDLIAARDASAGVADSSETPLQEDRDRQAESDGESVEEAREKLQSAFDDATEGMDTQVHDGKIWINKTPSAPDWTFSAFLQDPELVNYDPDADSPGQYWKNYIEADDVDEYISEVLE